MCSFDSEIGLNWLYLSLMHFCSMHVRGANSTSPACGHGLQTLRNKIKQKNIGRVPKVNRVASSGKVPGLFQSMCFLTNQLLLPRVLFAVDLLRCQAIQPASTRPIQFNAFNSDTYTKGASKNQSAATWELFTNIGNCWTDHTDSYSVSNVSQCIFKIIEKCLLFPLELEVKANGAVQIGFHVTLLQKSRQTPGLCNSSTFTESKDRVCMTSFPRMRWLQSDVAVPKFNWCLLGSRIQCPHVLLCQMIPSSCQSCGIKVSFGTDGFRRLLTKLQLILKAFPVMCINPIANVELRTTKAAARLGPLVDLMGMDHKNLRTNDSNPNFTRLKDCPIHE